MFKFKNLTNLLISSLIILICGIALIIASFNPVNILIGGLSSGFALGGLVHWFILKLGQPKQKVYNFLHYYNRLNPIDCKTTIYNESTKEEINSIPILMHHKDSILHIRDECYMEGSWKRIAGYVKGSTVAEAVNNLKYFPFDQS
jgi:hypothetical protein